MSNLKSEIFIDNHDISVSNYLGCSLIFESKDFNTIVLITFAQVVVRDGIAIR